MEQLVYGIYMIYFGDNIFPQTGY